MIDFRSMDFRKWRQMDTAPRGKWVTVMLKDGSIIERAHFAEDLSGSEQPPFSGWFVECGNMFHSIKTPVAWKPICPNDDLSHKGK